MIQALMIDVDGVLVNGRPSDGRHWSAGLDADLGLSYRVLQDAFFQRHWDHIVTGQADLRACLAPILSEIGPTLTADRLLTYWFERDARLNQELLLELATIRVRGLRVYLATNQEHERARYLMHRLGLAAYVDDCYYSAEIGHRKPTAAFFEIVASQVELLPRELLLIDDDADNVRAAVKAGWCAAQWTGESRLYDLLGKFLD